ncbi:MAG: acetate kinase [Candidatus Acidiferrales bacterium]
MKILVLNSGSSSQKSALYEIGSAIPEHPLQPLWEGKVEWNGEHGEIHSRNSRGAIQKTQTQIGSRKQAIDQLFDSLCAGESRAISSLCEIDAVGHRIVHGGREYQRPTLITPAVRETLSRLSIFAPLHNRAELEGIQIVEERFGSIAQIGVFDTAFHADLPEAAFVYPGPYEWLAQGIRRYGFHGINHQYCAERAAQLLAKDLRSLQLVTCHLGNGCSLAAIQNGHSIDTTMGFTPLEGLMMGTRSGSVDPGILTYLMRQGSLTAADLDTLLNLKSGLLGISGISGDMRDILGAMKKGHQRARLAFEIFTHRVRSGIGAMIAALGRMDVLVFTAGIGENAAEVRTAASENFDYIGLKLDVQRNMQASEDHEISARDSAVRVFVIHAREEWAIAKECWKITAAKFGVTSSAGQP